jgi:hypothetical protein
MKILVENLENRLYMDAGSQWVTLSQAYSFVSIALAVEICMLRGLRNVRIIIDTGDPEHDVSLEIRATRRHAPQRARTPRLACVPADHEHSLNFG